jgi:hypothetical protein
MATQTFAIAIKGTLEQVQQEIVRTAKREHAKVMATDPRPLRFTRYVDGRLGAHEEAVRGDGQITYLYPRIDAVVQFAMEMLFKFSPVDSGEYRNSHVIFLNGRAVTNLEGWKPGDDVAIANFLPYSRKIELGHMKMKVPGTSQVYEQAVSATNKRFRGVFKALYSWRGVVGGEAISPKMGASRARRGQGAAHNKSAARFPAMIFVEQ